jgi:hypothetical protein
VRGGGGYVHTRISNVPAFFFVSSQYTQQYVDWTKTKIVITLCKMRMSGSDLDQAEKRIIGARVFLFILLL